MLHMQKKTPANYIKETFKEEKRPAYTAKSEYPLNEGCVIFFKLVHMQHYQIFWLSDSHIFIKNCHLWYIDFWAFKENQNE